MDVPAISRASLSWTRGLAVISFLAVVWAAVQFGFLATALTQGPPAPDSRLVSEHHTQIFLYYLIFHAGAIVVFAATGLLAGKAANQVNRMTVGKRRSWFQAAIGLAFGIPAFALFAVFQVSGDSPMYQVYVDDTRQEIIRVETRLMPPGVTEEAVAYADVRVIEGEMDYSSWWGDRYFLKVVTLDWQTLEIARGSRGDDPVLLSTLAQDVADSVGVETDLGSKIPVFR